MNFRTTIVLLVVVAVLAGILLVLNLTGGPEDQTATETERSVLNIRSGDITKIVIAPASGTRIVLAKEKKDWRLVEPINAPADSYTADSLARGLAELKARGTAKTEMKDVAWNVEVHTTDGKVHKIRVAPRPGLSDNLRIQLEGDSRVTVVPADLCDHLEKPWHSFRQTRLTTAPSTDIRQVEITREDGRLVLHKTGSDWEVIEPERMPAESYEVSDITSAISSLSAVSSRGFVEESKVPAKLLPANVKKMTIWFSTSAPATQPSDPRPSGTTILVGEHADVLQENVYVSVSDPPALAKVSASSLNAFNKKVWELRNRNVVDIDPAQVSRVSITADKPAATQPTSRPASREQVTIERKKQKLELGPEAPPPATRPATTAPTTGPATAPATQPTTAPATRPAGPPPSDWNLSTSAGTGEASNSKVDALLQKLHPLRVDKYLAPDTAAPSEPAAIYMLEVHVEAPGGAKSVVHRIRLIDPGSDKPLFGQYNKVVFEVGRSLLDQLTADFANK